MPRPLRIIDTFLFSELFEKEILLLKLTIGGPHIHRWVILENTHTHQGEYKGLFAQEMLRGDKRFDPFLDRIHVISGDLKFRNLDYDNKESDKLGISQEWQQRDLVKEYLLEHFDDDDYFMISDTDECLDLVSHPRNLPLLCERVALNPHGVTQIPRMRYWFDVDNVWRQSRSVPLVSMRYFRERKNLSLGSIRVRHFGMCDPWERNILFEYSYCFPFEHLIRKYRTFCHVGMYEEDVIQALRCNHTPLITADKGKLSRNPKYWLEKVPLDTENSPTYVRENLTLLKTGIVNENYLVNRKMDYPNIFSAAGWWRWKAEQLSMLAMSIRKRLGHKTKNSGI